MRLGKQKLDTNQLIGRKWGTFFKIINDQVQSYLPSHQLLTLEGNPTSNLNMEQETNKKGKENEQEDNGEEGMEGAEGEEEGEEAEDEGKEEGGEEGEENENLATQEEGEEGGESSSQNEVSKEKQRKRKPNAQKLSATEILKMRNEGKSSNQIIQALVTNSATFSEKTEYAKQKYIKKKKTR